MKGTVFNVTEYVLYVLFRVARITAHLCFVFHLSSLFREPFARNIILGKSVLFYAKNV